MYINLLYGLQKGGRNFLAFCRNSKVASVTGMNQEESGKESEKFGELMVLLLN